MPAARTGLELVAAAGELTTHEPLQTRVGIVTGLVVAVSGANSVSDHAPSRIFLIRASLPESRGRGAIFLAMERDR
jgi:hypothetical protein